MSLVLLGSTSGSVTLQEPAIAGSTVIDLPATSGTMAVSGGTITTLTTTSGISVQGLTVGRGAGAVSTNTTVGASALAANTTGSSNTAVGVNALAANTTAAFNTAVGWNALPAVTTGGYNTATGSRSLYSNTTAIYNSAFGQEALYSNTTGASNTAVGMSALLSNTTASLNTAVGYQALYNSNSTLGCNTAVGSTAGVSLTTGGGNTFIGRTAGNNATTGHKNTFVGGSDGSTNYGAGYFVSTGSSNTIVGCYNGNQGGLDIRTASNYIVMSDGDGNPRLQYVYSSASIGYFKVQSNTTADSTNSTFQVINASGADIICEAGNNSTPPISGVIRVAKITSNSRSINAAGTVNQNGADYAEYMVKSGSFTIAKGDVCGINAEGKLTNVFADAISFCVKSTDPGLVGGDSWFTEPRPKDENNNELTSDTQEYAAWFARMEAARSTVDRIAFCGQVPVNVLGATSGQYIVPVNDNGAIKGEAVSNPTFEQYQTAVGKVIAIESDGRAKIIVKVA